MVLPKAMATKEMVMKDAENHEVLTSTEASGGVKLHAMRYVLAISLALAIVALSVVWISGAL